MSPFQALRSVAVVVLISSLSAAGVVRAQQIGDLYVVAAESGVELKLGEHVVGRLKYGEAFRITGVVGEKLEVDAGDRHGEIERAKTTDLPTALEKLGKRIEAEPDNLELRVRRGLLWKYKLDPVAGLAEVNEVLKRSPDRVDALLARSSLLTMLRDHKGALADSEKALKLDPTNARAHFMRGVDHLALPGMQEQALKDLAEAVRRDPNMQLALQNRGAALFALGRVGEAITDFNQALRYKPRFANAYAGRGACYAIMGEYEKAKDDFHEALVLEPKNIAALANLGKIAVTENDAAGCVKYGEELIRLSADSPRGHQLLGEGHLLRGENQKALEYFIKSVKYDPSRSEAYRARGSAYVKLKNFERAIADFDEAIRRNPKDGKALEWRAQVHRELKNYSNAREDATAAIELNPRRSFLRSFRGELFVLAKRTKDARQDFLKAVELDPKNAAGYAGLADVYALLRQEELAIAEYDKAITLQPTEIKYRMGRGYRLLNLERFDDARKNFDQVLFLDGSENAAGVYGRRGFSHASLGRREEALADYRKMVQLKPDSPYHLNMAALYLAGCKHDQGRDAPWAIELATKCCELTQWKNPSVIGTLAAAYSAGGDFKQANEYQRRAIAAVPKGTDASSLFALLKAYQQEKPYHTVADAVNEPKRPSPSSPPTSAAPGSTVPKSTAPGSTAPGSTEKGVVAPVPAPK